MKVLVTGSNGMLGRALLASLAGEHEVWGLGRSEPVSPHAHYLRADLTELGTYREAVESGAWDWVVHAASWTDVDGCEVDPERAYRVNVQGTENLLSCLRGRDARFIFLSTDYVFDGAKPGAYVEGDATRPLNVYGSTKLEAEACVAQAKLSAGFILRTSWLYGEGGVNFVDRILAAAERQSVLKVVADQIGAPTYAPDLAGGIRDFLTEASQPGHVDAGIYNLTAGGWTSWFHFAQEVLELSGSPARAIPISSEDVTRPARRPRNSMLSNEKIFRASRVALRPYRDALCEYLESEARRAHASIPLPRAPRAV